MTEAKLLHSADERRKHIRYGRRFRDFLIDADNAVKTCTKLVAQVSALILAALGAGMTIEVAWQEWKVQHAQFKTPPALVKPTASVK